MMRCETSRDVLLVGLCGLRGSRADLLDLHRLVSLQHRCQEWWYLCNDRFQQWSLLGGGHDNGRFAGLRSRYAAECVRGRAAFLSATRSVDENPPRLLAQQKRNTMIAVSIEFSPDNTRLLVVDRKLNVRVFSACHPPEKGAALVVCSAFRSFFWCNDSQRGRIPRMASLFLHSWVLFWNCAKTPLLFRMFTCWRDSAAWRTQRSSTPFAPPSTPPSPSWARVHHLWYVPARAPLFRRPEVHCALTGGPGMR